jgi:hypothetical protein
MEMKMKEEKFSIRCKIKIEESIAGARYVRDVPSYLLQVPC